VNALHGGFVYDDRFQVVRNPTIQSLGNLPRVFTQSVWQFLSAGSTEASGLYYRPVFNSGLILIHQAFGFRVVGWHLVSLALHVAATFLLFRLGLRWELSPSVAGAAALFFGLHPIHSESVAWIAALPDPLALVNLLGALLIYERVYHGPGGKRWMLVFSLALTLLAMLSKEVALIFPVWLLMREAMDHNAHQSRGLLRRGRRLPRSSPPRPGIYQQSRTTRDRDSAIGCPTHHPMGPHSLRASARGSVPVGHRL
jgi:hypothetical protein